MYSVHTFCTYRIIAYTIKIEKENAKEKLSWQILV